jgi:hypothetical protein
MIPPRKGEPRAKLEAEREALYARLLPAVYESVKARWPSVTVVGFGAGGAGRGDVRFIANVHGLNPDLGASYDVLSTHPYSKPVPFEAFHFKRWGGYASIESLSQIRQAMAGSGGADRPIWYTELGWPISHADGGRFAPPRAKGPFVSTLMQAAYIVRSYALAVRLGVGRVHTMHATDTDRFNGGVFTHDTGTWRPAAFATQTMIRLVPHPKLLGSIHDGDGGLYAYRFDPDATDKDATPVLMAWNVTGPMTVELPVAARARATAVDMLGHRTPLEVSGGEASVAIGPCPVYVTTTDEGN